jgi:hypothetical protein
MRQRGGRPAARRHFGDQIKRRPDEEQTVNAASKSIRASGFKGGVV